MTCAHDDLGTAGGPCRGPCRGGTPAPGRPLSRSLVAAGTEAGRFRPVLETTPAGSVGNVPPDVHRPTRRPGPPGSAAQNRPEAPPGRTKETTDAAAQRAGRNLEPP